RRRGCRRGRGCRTGCAGAGRGLSGAAGRTRRALHITGARSRSTAGRTAPAKRRTPRAVTQGEACRARATPNAAEPAERPAWGGDPDGFAGGAGRRVPPRNGKERATRGPEDSMNENGKAMGMVGLGVMGRNLALNMEEHGFSVAAWD